MGVYVEVINLAASTDRRDRMRKAFVTAGVTPNFFPAVHFREVDEQDLFRYCLPRGPWGRTQPGHMAATISHMKAWERFLSSNSQYCAIFEDDVYVSTELGNWFNDLSWWPCAADVVKLEAWRSKSTKVLLEPILENWLGRSVKKLLTRHMGAAGYMLNRKAAQRLIEARPYNMVIDHVLFNFNASPVSRDLSYYQVVPALVTQGNEPPRSTKMDQAEKISFSEFFVQETKRGILELAYPISSYWKFASGKAKLEKVRFKDIAETK